MKMSPHIKLFPAVLLTLILAAPVFAQTTVLPRESVWKYEDSGNNLGTLWRDPGFQDSAWGSGPGILGFGEPYIATPVADNDQITTYFRTEFMFNENVNDVLSLNILTNYDDGFAIYLNGQEVARRGLPAGTITYTTTATSHEGGAYETIDISTWIGELVSGTNQLAVEVHQRLTTSSDVVWDAEVTYSTTAEVTRGPYLQVGTPTSVVFRWRTNVATDTQVRYGSAPGSLTQTVTGLTPTTEHEIQIDALSPDTRYFYAVGSTAGDIVGDTSEFFFDTSPIPGTKKQTRVWVVGDSGTGDTNAAAVRNGFRSYTGSREPDVWLMLGDNAYTTGTDAEYEAAVFDMYPTILQQCVVWPTRGNHDVLHSGLNNDYYEIFTLPDSAEAGGEVSGTEAYYSFDFANIHFICLDSEASATSAAMYSWLQTDLDNTAQDWIIAYWHHPPYTKGSHDSDDNFDSGGRMRDMRVNALPILEGGGVDLVLTGHSHSYERSFLLDGHYDVSATLESGMILNSGDGRVDGAGAYSKPGGGVGNQGAVYAVAGSSGKTSGGPLNHPVMYVSLNILGSMIIDVDENQLDAVFINTAGTDSDHFTVVKSPVTGVGDGGGPASGPGLRANFPNPFSYSTRISYRLPEAGAVKVTVFDIQGRPVRTLVNTTQDAGEHEAVWDGIDDDGRVASPGVYFTVLESGGLNQTRKLVLSR